MLYTCVNAAGVHAVNTRMNHTAETCSVHPNFEMPTSRVQLRAPIYFRLTSQITTICVCKFKVNLFRTFHFFFVVLCYSSAASLAKLQYDPNAVMQMWTEVGGENGSDRLVSIDRVSTDIFQAVISLYLLILLPVVSS